MTYPLTKLVQLFVAQIIIQLFLFGPSSTSSEAADLTKKLVDSNGHAMALWHKQAEDVASTKQIILLMDELGAPYLILTYKLKVKSYL